MGLRLAGFWLRVWGGGSSIVAGFVGVAFRCGGVQGLRDSGFGFKV